MKDREYVVQMLIIKEVTVKTFDELQAERKAWQQADKRDKDNVIGMRVMEEADGQGALDGDTKTAMKFVREKFAAVDPTWVKT